MPYLLGYSPQQQVSYDTLNSSWRWNNVHPEFKNRLMQLFQYAHRRGKTAGLGGSYRTHAEQLNEFLRRYSPISKSSYDSNKTNCKVFPYNGNIYWRLIPGKNALATPGASYHEATVGSYCVGADVVGDTDYLIFMAPYFGLRWLPGANEPWHLQPFEFPNSKWDYDPNIHQMIEWPETEELIDELILSYAQGVVLSRVPKAPIGYLSTGTEAKKLIVQLKLWGLYDGPSIYGIDKEHLYAIKRFKLFINQFLGISLTVNNLYDAATEQAYYKLRKLFYR